MKDKRPIHTVPHGDGWANRREGNQRVTEVFDTQREAQVRARDVAAPGWDRAPDSRAEWRDPGTKQLRQGSLPSRGMKPAGFGSCLRRRAEPCGSQTVGWITVVSGCVETGGGIVVEHACSPVGWIAEDTAGSVSQ